MVEKGQQTGQEEEEEDVAVPSLGAKAASGMGSSPSKFFLKGARGLGRGSG